MATRTKRSVGWPTAAVMRRTWRLRPSRITNSIHAVGMLARWRIGGSRGHSAGSGNTLQTIKALGRAGYKPQKIGGKWQSKEGMQFRLTVQA